jgi:hypothetical protein
LGLIRSKFGTVPVPNADVTLNGTELVSQAREEQSNLKTQLAEMLESLTYDKLIETKATSAEALQRQLKTIPIPNGLAITMG